MAGHFVVVVVDVVVVVVAAAAAVTVVAVVGSVKGVYYQFTVDCIIINVMAIV